MITQRPSHDLPNGTFDQNDDLTKMAVRIPKLTAKRNMNDHSLSNRVLLKDSEHNRSKQFPRLNRNSKFQSKTQKFIFQRRTELPDVMFQ